MSSVAARTPHPLTRHFIAFSIALLAALALFWLMQHMIHAPEGNPLAERRVEEVSVVAAKQPDDKPPDPLNQPDAPQAPAAPSALRFDGPTLPVPSVNVLADAGPIRIPLNIGGGSSLGRGAFGGFARGSGSGSGGGGGGGGFGRGEGFVGKDLVPLSTARPQFPEYAYKRGIEGWVEVSFTVMTSGRVQDVKIIDANPKGVFEATTVESVSNWIYGEYPKARTVKQRVEFKLEDFKYNWR